VCPKSTGIAGGDFSLLHTRPRTLPSVLIDDEQLDNISCQAVVLLQSRDNRVETRHAASTDSSVAAPLWGGVVQGWADPAGCGVPPFGRGSTPPVPPQEGHLHVTTKR
jgi:hypothetical protein